MKRLIFSFLICFILFQYKAKAKDQRLPRHVQEAVYKAQQAIIKKDYINAEKILKKFIEKHKRSHYLIEFTLGNLLFQTDRKREALYHYKGSTNLYPDYSDAWQNMGTTYFDLKQYEKAGNCFLRAYEINEKRHKNKPDVLYYAAISYIMAKKEKKALPHLQQLVSGKLGPPKTEWLQALLKVYIDLKLEERAFNIAYTLIDKEGDDPRWWKILAQLYLQKGDYKNAVAAFTIYSYLTPLNQEETMLLADLYYAIGLPLVAAKYYERAVTFKSDRASYYEKLASAYIAAHRPDKAKDALNRALNIKPTSQLWFMMAQILYEREKFKEAYEALRKSTKLNPKKAEAWLLMGYCALHMDKKDLAREALKKASKFPKQKKMAKELLKQIISREKR